MRGAAGRSCSLLLRRCVLLSVAVCCLLLLFNVGAMRGSCCLLLAG